METEIFLEQCWWNFSLQKSTMNLWAWECWNVLLQSKTFKLNILILLCWNSFRNCYSIFVGRAFLQHFLWFNTNPSLASVARPLSLSLWHPKKEPEWQYNYCGKLRYQHYTKFTQIINKMKYGMGMKVENWLVLYVGQSFYFIDSNLHCILC